MANVPPFHLAFAVRDLESTRRFYTGLLGCAEGRSAATWVDFDFFGHQLSAHVQNESAQPADSGLVDDIDVPIPHFGCVLDAAQFQRLRRQFENSGTAFLIAPQIRYAGGVGEQQTMFVRDPSGNALEFKCVSSESALFKN